MNNTSGPLLEMYATLGQVLVDIADRPDTAAAISQLAVSMIPGVEQASITDGQSGKFRTVASTGDVALRGDQIQYELDSGPCVDAILLDTVFRTGDVAADSRWQRFGARAHAETGTTSMMSLRLFPKNEDYLTGLNLYSTERDAFDEDAQAIAIVLASYSALALLTSGARAQATNLIEALTTNRRIGIAVGILMTGRQVSEEDAFVLLRAAGREANCTLLEAADDVIRTGVLL